MISRIRLRSAGAPRDQSCGRITVIDRARYLEGQPEWPGDPATVLVARMGRRRFWSAASTTGPDRPWIIPQDALPWIRSSERWRGLRARLCRFRPLRRAGVVRRITLAVLIGAATVGLLVVSVRRVDPSRDTGGARAVVDAPPSPASSEALPEPVANPGTAQQVDALIAALPAGDRLVSLDVSNAAFTAALETRDPEATLRAALGQRLSATITYEVRSGDPGTSVLTLRGVANGPPSRERVPTHQVGPSSAPTLAVLAAARESGLAVASIRDTGTGQQIVVTGLPAAVAAWLRIAGAGGAVPASIALVAHHTGVRAAVVLEAGGSHTVPDTYATGSGETWPAWARSARWAAPAAIALPDVVHDDPTRDHAPMARTPTPAGTVTIDGEKAFVYWLGETGTTRSAGDRIGSWTVQEDGSLDEGN